MSHSAREQRFAQIIAILKGANAASIKQLAAELQVSEMTVHRDLGLLRDSGIVRLVHGAAIFNADAVKADADAEYHVVTERGVYDAEKVRIGRKAASMVAPGDVVFIDIGTTAEHIAGALPDRGDFSVVCCTLNVLNKVLPKNPASVAFSGGYYHRNTQLFECPEMLPFFQKIRATKMFVTAAGVDPTLGLTCSNHHEATTKQAGIAASAQKILTVDSSKFGVVKPAYFAALGDVQTVITDRRLSEEWREIIRSMAIELILV